MRNPRYIITDFEGTFTNTHDVVSGPIASQDSPVIIEQIHSEGVRGVYGCTHRNTDGFAGFMQLIEWGQGGIAEEVRHQKLEAITQRLGAVCQHANVPFLGVSTEYDRQGLFLGYRLVVDAENVFDKEEMVHGERKLDQLEKNAQIQQIIDDIATKESGHSNLIIIDFYDDKLQILEALERARLRMPPNMELRLWHYKFSINDEPLTQVATIKSVQEAPQVLGELASVVPHEDEPQVLDRPLPQPSNNRFFSRNKVLIAQAVAYSAGAISVGVLVGLKIALAVTTPLLMCLSASIVLALLAIAVVEFKNHFASQSQNIASSQL